MHHIIGPWHVPESFFSLHFKSGQTRLTLLQWRVTLALHIQQAENHEEGGGEGRGGEKREREREGREVDG